MTSRSTTSAGVSNSVTRISIQDKLFLAERRHRVDVGGRTGGKIAGGHSDGGKQESGAGEEDRVGGGVPGGAGDLLEQAAEESDSGASAGEADHGADGYDGESLLHDEAQDVSTARADGHADADLAPPAGDPVRRDTAHSDAGQHEPENADVGVGPAGATDHRDHLFDVIGESALIEGRDALVDSGDLAPDGGHGIRARGRADQKHHAA